MTLAGTVSLKYMDVDNGLIVHGLLIAIAIGIAIGICNFALIRLLHIPPIIATLSMSFVVQSTAIWTNRGLRIKPPEVMANFTTASTFGIPNIAIVALVLAFVAQFVLQKTVYGRWMAAIGQNSDAARMAWHSCPWNAIAHLRHLRGSCSHLRLPQRLFFGRRGAQHGCGISFDVHRRGDYWRHSSRWRGFERAGNLGRFAVHVSGCIDAQHLRAWGWHSHDHDWSHHHYRHSGRQWQIQPAALKS